MTHVEVLPNREARNERAADLKARGHHVHKTTSQEFRWDADLGKSVGRIIWEVRWSERCT